MRKLRDDVNKIAKKSQEHRYLRESGICKED